MSHSSYFRTEENGLKTSSTFGSFSFSLRLLEQDQGRYPCHRLGTSFWGQQLEKENLSVCAALLSHGVEREKKIAPVIFFLKEKVHWIKACCEGAGAEFYIHLSHCHLHLVFPLMLLSCRHGFHGFHRLSSFRTHLDTSTCSLFPLPIGKTWRVQLEKYFWVMLPWCLGVTLIKTICHADWSTSVFDDHVTPVWLLKWFFYESSRLRCSC